jgi:hypothetical protein
MKFRAYRYKITRFGVPQYRRVDMDQWINTGRKEDETFTLLIVATDRHMADAEARYMAESGTIPYLVNFTAEEPVTRVLFREPR